jgi:SAM-dependent methyltransferase
MATSALRNRLKAWWEGYDGQEYHAWLTSRSRGNPAPQKPAKERSARRKAGLRRETAWKSERIDISNLIWGDGYCGPGGPQHVIDLVKLLGLTPEMSVLLVGGGLGGPARVLAKEFGCYVDAIEQSKELAAAGSEMSHVAGLSKKAAIEHYDFGRCPPFKRKYDAAISTEALFTVENKPGVLKAAHAALKPCKLLVVTDYVLDDAADPEDPDLQQWFDNEPTEIFPIQNDAMINLIEQAHFNLRVKEDVSETVRSQIARSWASAGEIAQKLLDRGDEGRPMVDTLLREAIHWSRRSSLLDKHKVRVMRYLAERTWYD